MGNTGDFSFVPALGEAMQEADGMVRSHVAWALGRIGGTQAKRLLETSLACETDETAKKEMQAALGTA
jgi:epoxyqueuosine reductase